MTPPPMMERIPVLVGDIRHKLAPDSPFIESPASTIYNYRAVPVLDTDGNPVPAPIRADATRFLVAEDPDTKFGDLPPTSLDGFIAAANHVIGQMAVIGSLPPYYLLGHLANLSADALSVAESSLQRLISQLQHTVGESWERVMALFAQALGREVDYSAEVQWRDMSPRSFASTVDGIVKLVESGVIPRTAARTEVPGLTAALAAYAEWAKVNVAVPVLTAEIIAHFVHNAHLLRGVSRRLASRYYNLSRAISLGTAFPDIAGDFAKGETVQLQDLYSAMAHSLNEVATSTLDLKLPNTPAIIEAAGKRSLEQRLADLEGSLVDWFKEAMPDDSAMSEPVTVDVPEPDWNWPEFDETQDDQDLMAELEKIEQQMKDEAAKERRTQDTLNESLKRLEKNAQQQAANAAGRADEDVQSPGRLVVRTVGGVDKGRYAWMRVTGPEPCGFCSMLASRGAVYDTAAVSY